MSKILLAIKPEYVAKIFNQTKLYEFRRKIPQKPVSTVVVYATEPEHKIVGEFEVMEVLSMKPTPLWEKTKDSAGIARAKYREYFRDCTTAYAYRIGRIYLYDSPKSIEELGIKHPPQSFVYLKG